MPTFIVIITVSANSMDEALEKAREFEGPMEVLDTDQNRVMYKVDGHVDGFDGPVLVGELRYTWQEALTAYLAKNTFRNKDMEVLVLSMAVNGDDPVPVWEQAFFDHVAEKEIPVKSVRDPRDSSDQLTKS